MVHAIPCVGIEISSVIGDTQLDMAKVAENETATVEAVNTLEVQGDRQMSPRWLTVSEHEHEELVKGIPACLEISALCDPTQQQNVAYMAGFKDAETSDWISHDESRGLMLQSVVFQTYC